MALISDADKGSVKAPAQTSRYLGTATGSGSRPTPGKTHTPTSTPDNARTLGRVPPPADWLK